MGANAGPDIVSDGLVLALDAADNNSFRGEPTTNVVTNPQPTTGWGTANSQGSSITRSFLTEDGIPFMRFSNVVNGSDYPRVTDSVFANSATITGTFSTSLEVRGTPEAQLRLRIYENGSTKITNTITLTDKWVRYKFENQTTGFALNQPYFNPVTTGATYDIRNIQIEAKPSATRFVNGTRGTTVATGGGWADISGNSNHGEILNGTSTSNDNTVLGALDFDGTNDYITTANTTIAGSQTFSVWAMVTGGPDSPAGILTQHNYASTANFGINHISGNKLAPSIGYTNGTREFASKPTNFSITHNVIFNAALVYNSTENKIYWYINGQLDSSYTLSATPKSTNYPICLGRWDGGYNNYYFNGRVYLGNIYNKALTAQEVLQNYNATKTRFGL